MFYVDVEYVVDVAMLVIWCWICCYKLLLICWLSCRPMASVEATLSTSVCWYSVELLLLLCCCCCDVVVVVACIHLHWLSWPWWHLIKLALMTMFKLELCSPRWPRLAKLATKAYALALMAIFKLGVLLRWYHMHVHSWVAFELHVEVVNIITLLLIVDVVVVISCCYQLLLL